MAESKDKDTAHANGNGRRVLGPQDVQRSREIKEVELPGYEGVFRIQKIGWRELEEINLACEVTITDREGNTRTQQNRRMYLPRFVAAAWVDEHGERYLKNFQDAEVLGDSDVLFINHMFEAVSKFNSIGNEARAEVGKDSSGTSTASGGSTSVSKS
jgi:hypothetical protein